MKIGMFAESFFTLDGGSSSLRNLTQALQDKGIDVQIFAPALNKVANKFKFVHPIPSIKAWPTFPDNIRLPLPYVSQSLKKAFNQKYDLIHGHSHGFFPLLGLFIARKQKIPFVMTFHTLVGHYAHYFLNGKVVKPQHLNHLLLKQWVNWCDGIIAPSEKMRDVLLSVGVKKPIAIIPNFVDTSIFKNQPSGFLHRNYGIKKDAPIILTVGRLGKEKNHLYTLKVFKEISQIDDKSHLVIIGEGSDYKKLSNFIKHNKLSERVHLAGTVSFVDMPKAYADASIFVLSSVSENNPMSVIEAGASGLPIIVVKDSAYTGIVKENFNGYQIAQDNPELYARKIVDLLNNPKKLKQFGKNSLSITEKGFSQKVVVDKMIKFYEKTIAANKKV